MNYFTHFSTRRYYTVLFREESMRNDRYEKNDSQIDGIRSIQVKCLQRLAPI